MLLRMTGRTFGCDAACEGGGTGGEADSVLSGAGGFQFCTNVNGASTTRGCEDVHFCVPLCKVRPVFRPKSPEPRSPGKRYRASKRIARPRSSRVYPSGCSHEEQTMKENGAKGDVGALSRSKGPPCLSLALGVRRCLRAADHQQENVKGCESSLMIRKSLERPCPIKVQPKSTSSRSFLYTTFNGVNVYGDVCGSRSPSSRACEQESDARRKKAHI